MPGERVSMRKIREVLRLRFAQGMSQRAIGHNLRLSAGAVNTWATPQLLSSPVRVQPVRWPETVRAAARQYPQRRRMAAGVGARGGAVTGQDDARYSRGDAA